jgi:protein-tyrosine phosphatase
MQSFPVKVLLVCMGNICRSPTAEGVLRDKLRTAGLASRVQTDSAGTHDYHIGKPPDRRAQGAARRRGYDLSALRARQVGVQDFADFDLILAMDQDNYLSLMQLCPESYRHKVRLFLSYSHSFPDQEVPDPYYGGSGGFDVVLDMVEDAVEGLIASLADNLADSGR